APAPRWSPQESATATSAGRVERSTGRRSWWRGPATTKTRADRAATQTVEADAASPFASDRHALPGSTEASTNPFRRRAERPQRFRRGAIPLATRSACPCRLSRLSWERWYPSRHPIADRRHFHREARRERPEPRLARRRRFPRPARVAPRGQLRRRSELVSAFLRALKQSFD